MRTVDCEPTIKMTKRMFGGVFIPLLLLAIGVVGKLIFLTVRDHQTYAEMANNTHFTNKTITAGRGAIYDSNGEPLAWSATVYKVFIDPKQFQKEMDEIEEVMKNRQALLDAGETLSEGTLVITRDELENQIVQLLSEKLNISEDTILTAMEKNTQYYVLQSQVEKNVADEIMEFFDKLNMDSITTEEDSKRYYPQNELAAQVIGFTNSDGNGQYGLEAYYDEYLSGVNGRVTTAKDGLGNTMPYRYSTTYEAQDGSSLYLTLDSTLQYYLEKNLQEMSQTYEVNDRSCGIIMNAKTGAIYAMATYPSFDLNNPSQIFDENTSYKLNSLPEDEYQDAYVSAREMQWKNKAITELYVPGSVFKIFTTAMAVEENAVNPDRDYFNCTGSVTFAGTPPTTIHCHLKSGHGMQSFSEALTNSCNPAFMEVGKRVGIHKFCQYFSAFGLTERTGIDLPSEISSLYIDESRMGQIELASSSFGQTNTMTPIEMITGIAASINGGYLVEPHVVDKIVSSDGNVIKTFGTNIKRQVISKESSATVRKLLQAVVDNNGGSNAYIKGYAIGGKSGTSQKVINGKVSEDHYVASYTCFAPANDPEIVMLVMADDPNPNIGYYGSKVTAPCARNIMEESLKYLGYYPEYTEAEYEELDVTVPLLLDEDVAKAQETLEALGLKYQTIGDGETVLGQCPSTGLSISPEGTVILYTVENYMPDKVEVPDLQGFTATDANEALTNRGLNYVAVGASTDRSDVLVLSQSIEAGTMVDVGTVIQLTYFVNDQTG